MTMIEVDETLHPTLGVRGRKWLHEARGLLRELWQDKLGSFGFLILASMLLLAIVGGPLAPHEPTAQDLRLRLTPPFWQEGGSLTHPLGTDSLGRDVLSRLMYGARSSMFAGLAVVAIAGTFGTIMGLLSGYRGGITDAAIMRATDTLVAFPGLLLALVILAVVGPSLWMVVVVLSINGWMIYARITRGIVLSVRETGYVEAAQIIGSRMGRVIFRHILPNLASPLLTLAVLEFARIILAEAAISYLGLGVQPPQTSWGLDAAIGQGNIFSAWWLVTFPAVAIAVTVLGTNLFASWLRVVTDPQEREKRYAFNVKAVSK